MATVDELIRQLESEDTDERYEAAKALGELGNPIAVPALLRSREIYSRAVDTLIEAVQDDLATDEVRAAAAEALGKTRDPKAIPVLTEQLREDKPTSIATAAARALRHFNDPQAIHALAKTAANREIAIDVREVAFESIANIGNPNTVDTLISILEDPSVDYYFRSKAARALGRIGDPKAIEPLIRTLENETTWSGGTVREAIAEALGAFRDRRATDALVAALASDYLSASAAAASLKRLRDKRAVEPLIRILEGDPSQHRDHEREFAAQILGVLGDPRAIPALVNALYDDFSELVPKYASESLQLFVLAYPDAIMQIPPEDRHRLGRLIQDAQREELLQEICGHNG